MARVHQEAPERLAHRHEQVRRAERHLGGATLPFQALLESGAVEGWLLPRAAKRSWRDAVQDKDVGAYRSFFTKEASLNKEMIGVQVLELDGIKESPMKVRRLASKASSTAATPQRWGSAKTLTEALQD